MINCCADMLLVYHLHDAPVPSDGNCTGTLAHLDPYQRGEVIFTFTFCITYANFSPSRPHLATTSSHKPAKSEISQARTRRFPTVPRSSRECTMTRMPLLFRESALSLAIALSLCTTPIRPALPVQISLSSLAVVVLQAVAVVQQAFLARAPHPLSLALFLVKQHPHPLQALLR